MGRYLAALVAALGLALPAMASDWTVLRAEGFSAELPGAATHIRSGDYQPEQWLLVGGDGAYAIFLVPTAGEADEAVLDTVLDSGVEAMAGQVQRRWTVQAEGRRVRWADFEGQASDLPVAGQAIAIARPGAVLVAMALTPEGGDPAGVARFLNSVTITN